MFLSTVETSYILLSILLLIISYFIGSIPFGIIVGKLACDKDIRYYGSKNIGSTNAIRVLGKKIGFIVFFLDVFKGMVIIIIVKTLRLTNVCTLPIEDLWFGLAAILGHSFSIFLDFKGGKAVATSLGVVLLICPLAGLLCLVAFVIVLYSTGYVSLASTFATLTVLITSWVLYFVGIPNIDINDGLYIISKTSLTTCIIISLVSILIFVKHIKNYKRLLNGTENSFKKNKAKA